MSADDLDSATFQDQPITQLLVKVATRCNIDCSYCYWFRDAAVYNKPKLMSAGVLHQLLQRIEAACRQIRPRRFSHHFARRRALAVGS